MRQTARIETEFEVDQNRNGVPWHVRVLHGGALVFSGTRVTHAPSGSFELRRLLADAPGRDRIAVRATRASGEICSASGRI